MRRAIGLTLTLCIAALWLYISIPSIMLLIIGPVAIFSSWTGGRAELTVLMLDGFVAALWLLIKPIIRLDKAVRDANDRARLKHQ